MDKIVESIFNQAFFVKRSDDIVRKAEIRAKLGNPPGKSRSIGDAVNWESLLSKVDRGIKLIIVSKDGDYADSLDKTQVSFFLKKERNENKNSEVELYSELHLFFEKFFNLILRNERDKAIQLLISQLENSSSFSKTHEVIEELAKYVDFLTQIQSEKILKIYNGNDQVSLIKEDNDVKNFYSDIHAKYPNVNDS